MPLLRKKRQKVTTSDTQVTNNEQAPISKGVADRINTKTEQCADVTFVFILQDFSGTVSDELSVLRGQIVRPLYSEDVWLYVQNVDGICGYIPTANSCSINDIKERWHQVPVFEKRNKITVENYETIDQPRLSSSSAFPCGSLPTSPNITHFSRTRKVQTPCQTDPELVVPQVIKRKLSEPSTIIELSSSPYKFTHPEPKLHPLHPLSLSRSSANYDKARADRKTSIVSPATPVVKPLSAVHLRTESYQEAVHTDENLRMVPAQIQCPYRPSNLPLHLSHSNTYWPETFATTSVGLRTYTHESHLDDVFLPSVSKPIGIYKTLKSYNKTVPGEVSLKENEYIIVTESGCGEWAWVVTSSGSEGVIPKSIIARYTPNGVTTIGTQTELMIMGPTRTISLPSGRRESRVSQLHSACSQRRQTAEIAVQTDYIYSPMVMDAWISPSQTMDDLWYENSMSIPRLTGLGLNCDTPSICTLPTMNGLNHEFGVASSQPPLAFHSSRQSLPRFPVVHPVKSTLPTPSEDQGKWICSPKVATNFNNTDNKPQTVVLTAVKSFTPEPQARSDYLTLKKGDVLHVYPGSTTISNKGWIWVYHLNKNTYGFVPKSHTEFIYLAPNANGCKHVGVTRYDEV